MKKVFGIALIFIAIFISCSEDEKLISKRPSKKTKYNIQMKIFLIKAINSAFLYPTRLNEYIKKSHLLLQIQKEDH